MRPAGESQPLVLLMSVLLQSTVCGRGPVDRKRVRRSASILTPAEQKFIVDFHNKLRRQEGASDMELMVISSWENHCCRFLTVLRASVRFTRFKRKQNALVE